MGAPVDPLGPSCGLQGAITVPLPERPHTMDSALVREFGHTAACLRVAVPQDEMGVRVVRVRAGGVNGRQPGCPPGAHILGKRPDQALPPRAVQLARQGNDDLVDHAGVFAVGPFLCVQP